MEMKCPNDGTAMVDGTQIGGGMTFAYIAPPESSSGPKTVWLHTKVCPKCGLVQPYIKEPEIYAEKW